MDEGERILERLRRIELLEQERVGASVLLAEVRALLADAEIWVRSEGRGDAQAEAAVDALRDSLAGGEDGVLAAERTLVA